MQTIRSVGRPKLEGRRTEILFSAAQYFAKRGFDAATVREISVVSNMHTSSLYHFFGSKERLFEEVYQEGVKRIMAAVQERVLTQTNPWERLEAAAIAHLNTLLEDDVFSIVVASTIPKGENQFEKRLIVHRNKYEKMFAQLISVLPRLSKEDALYLRLTLLGALNATVGWYKPGKDNPEKIARSMVGLFRRQLDSNSIAKEEA